MPKIRILPENISNRIAAGEVVERPASVVKELVENAIDAGSTRIFVEIEKGGRSLIRVSDNGCGMDHDNTLLALERYATSKIASDNDLFAISTLGFRGEAVPSIASVSKFTIISRSKEVESGTEIYVEGGSIKKVSETGAPIGTMVSVKQLFFNTPARRKFLKSVNTEMAHIADTIATIALGWPGIQFKLVHNKRTVKNWPAARDLFDRAVDVLGKDVRNSLNSVGFKDRQIAVSGWTSSPSVTRSTSKKIYLFVNGRCIRDRGLQHALTEGYRGRLMKGRFPVAVIFLTVPFDRVDVNVHPTKNEVRFSDQKRVYEVLNHAVSDIWHKVDRRMIIETDHPRPVKQKPVAPMVSETVSGYDKQESLAFSAKTIDHTTKPVPQKNSSVLFNETKSSDKAPTPFYYDESDKVCHIKPEEKQATIWKEMRFADLRIVGQIKNTYIICESEEGFFLVDQHAAHERILFEKLKKRPSSSSMSSQRLLIPETFETGYKEAEILEKIIPDLNRLGLEIEPFGGNTFVVKSVPGLISEKEAGPIVLEIVAMMEETGFAPGLEKTLDECLILMACHGAIRANQSLSDKEMSELLIQLDECDNPSSCPHGRPTWIRWTETEIEKKFKRIV